MKKMYLALNNEYHEINWKKIFLNNVAQPIAQFVMWLAFHERLATKERLCTFGMEYNTNCCFCPQVESIQHIMFGCNEMKKIWKNVLSWIQMNHEPEE